MTDAKQNNYQVGFFSHFWHAFNIIAVFAVGFMGVSAPLLYLLGIYMVYPIILSMVFCDWERKGVAVRESSNRRWIVYINGIPVRETRKALVNIHFKGRQDLVSRLLFVAKLKVFFIACIVAIAGYDLIVAVTGDVSGIFSYLLVVMSAAALIFSVYKLKLALSLHRTGLANDWYIHTETIQSTLLFSAYLVSKRQGHDDQYQTFLMALLS